MQKEYDFSNIAATQGIKGTGQNSGVLYVTDEPDCYKDLKGRGCYVVPYLHEGNRGVTFPDARYVVEDLQEIEEEALERIYRRIAGLPWNICETKRCLIRETTEEDLDSFYEIYREPSITKYMEGLYPDRQEELAYIKNYREYVYAFYGYGMWTVLEKDSGRVIGRAGLSEREGFTIPELGFVIGLTWQRQGYAYEVCVAILQLAKEELEMERVQAFVLQQNVASAKLCGRLGFVRNGKERLEDGLWYDRYERNLTV